MKTVSRALMKFQRARELRRELQVERRRNAILAGECLCSWDQAGMVNDEECPQMPEHLAQLAGYKTWICRECELPTMFRGTAEAMVT